MEAKNEGVVILGAGMTGLVAGHLLPGSVLCEKSPFIGGTCRTIHHKDFHFDVGIHWLSPLEQEAEEFLKRFEAHRVSKIKISKNDISVFKDGRRSPGFFSPYGAFKLSHPLRGAGILATYYFRKVFPRKPSRSENPLFEDLLINQYGDLLYRWVVKGWLEKQWGESPDQMVLPGYRLPQSPPLLSRLLRRVLRTFQQKQKQFVEVFYPQPWFGALVEKLSKGLEIRISSELTQVRLEGDRVVAIEINHQETLPCNQLVITVPPHAVIPLFNPPREIQERASKIRYRDLIYVVLFFEQDHLTDEYLGVAIGREIFFRATEPKKWGQAAAPPGKTSVCFEIPCSKEDPIWKLPDAEIARRVWEDFRPYYPAPEPFDGVVLRIPRAWPIFTADLEENLSSIQDFVTSFRNVFVQSKDYVLKGNNVNAAFKEAFRLAQEVKQALEAQASDESKSPIKA